jgi:hypothetical protein
MHEATTPGRAGLPARAHRQRSWLVAGSHPTADHTRRHELGELLREIERDLTDAPRIVERHADLNPARDWLDRRALVREVRR